MSDILNIFSENELEEIKDLKELSVGASINETSIECFFLLDKIITKEITINELSKSDLDEMLRQMELVNKFWGSFEWFDNNVLESIITKLKNLFFNSNNVK